MNNFLDEGIRVGDFVRGQRDCKNGVPHEAGKSASYDRGYAAEYELEQIKSEWSDQELIR